MSLPTTDVPLILMGKICWSGMASKDLTAGTKQAKFVFTQNPDIPYKPKPFELPPNRKNVMFFARIHNVDGSISNVDTYVVSTTQLYE